MMGHNEKSLTNPYSFSGGEKTEKSFPELSHTLLQTPNCYVYQKKSKKLSFAFPSLNSHTISGEICENSFQTIASVNRKWVRGRLSGFERGRKRKSIGWK